MLRFSRLKLSKTRRPLYFCDNENIEKSITDKDNVIKCFSILLPLAFFQVLSTMY